MAAGELPADLLDRHVAGRVREYVDDFRVTMLNGPRQAGKTTLLRQLRQTLGGTMVTFDDEDQRSAVRADPRGYLESLPRPLFVDEAQRGGEPFLLAVKAEVDRHPDAGALVLASSTRFPTAAAPVESMAGRVGVVELWPLSVAERTGAPPTVLDQLFTDPAALTHARTEPVTRHEYLQLALAGGFPDALHRRSARSRANWYRSYLETVTRREVRDLARIRRGPLLPRLVRLLAALTGAELNAARLAEELGVDAETVRHYVSLLEQVYLVHLLPAWSRRVDDARGRRRLKAHLTDTGLAGWLREQSASRLARPRSAAVAAPLFETFVLDELVKLSSAARTRVSFWHYQDRSGGEVDYLLEATGGEVVAVAVKTAASTRAEDFQHLARLRDALGDDLRAGVVIFAGSAPVRFGDRLYALPASLLWGGGRPPPAAPSQPSTAAGP